MASKIKIINKQESENKPETPTKSITPNIHNKSSKHIKICIKCSEMKKHKPGRLKCIDCISKAKDRTNKKKCTKCRCFRGLREFEKIKIYNTCHICRECDYRKNEKKKLKTS